MYEWTDRPHEPVTAMRVRARITDPAPGATIPAAQYSVRGKAWSGTGPVTKVEGQPHRRRRLAPHSARRTTRALRVAELVVRLGSDEAGPAHAPRPRHRRRGQRATRG